MPSDKGKVGDMSRQDLIKLIQRVMQGLPAALPTSYEGEDIRSTGRTIVDGDIELSDLATQTLKSRLGIP